MRDPRNKLPDCPQCGERCAIMYKDHSGGRIIICWNPNCPADEISSDGERVISTQPDMHETPDE